MNTAQDNRPAFEALLTSGEVAQLLRVDVKTVTRWARNGHLSYFKTPGGQHRFREAEVRAILNGGRP